MMDVTVDVRIRHLHAKKMGYNVCRLTGLKSLALHDTLRERDGGRVRACVLAKGRVGSGRRELGMSSVQCYCAMSAGPGEHAL